MIPWWSLIIAFFVGNLFGIFIMGLMVASGKDDREGEL